MNRGGSSEYPNIYEFNRDMGVDNASDHNLSKRSALYQDYPSDI